MRERIDRNNTIEHLKKRLYETAFNNSGAFLGDTDFNDLADVYADIAENRIANWINELPHIPMVDIKYCKEGNLDLVFQPVQLYSFIVFLAEFCHNRQTCNGCILKNWCKNFRNKCPEEWRNKVWQEIDTQAVDQDKKN